jgi:hypothetical protein
MLQIRIQMNTRIVKIPNGFCMNGKGSFSETSWNIGDIQWRWPWLRLRREVELKISITFTEKENYWMRELGTATPYGCNDKINGIGILSSATCISVNVMDIFNFTSRRRRSHGHRHYISPIFHDVYIQDDCCKFVFIWIRICNMLYQSRFVLGMQFWKR